MTTYADPTRCPDCRAVLPHDPQTCRVCSLPLTGATAASLFTTLQEADRLLGVLRAEERPDVAITGATPTATSGSRLVGVEQYPAPPRSRTGHDSPRVSGISVPRILLSLGALCLLVAAVIFLAVAWSWLGVGGRTVVLAALTAFSLGLSTALLRRGLRMAAEALSVVGLGLLALDVVGARHADWLRVDDAGLTLVTGAVVATAALALLVVSASRPMVAPALVAPIAVLVAALGAQWHVEPPLPMAVALVLLLGLGRVGTILPSTPLTATTLAVTVIGWLYLLAAGLDDTTSRLTAEHVWGDVAAWPLVTCVVIAAAVGPATGVRHGVDTCGYAVAATLAGYVAVLPVLDNQPDAAVLSLLGLTALWTGIVAGTPAHRRLVPTIALAGVVPVPVGAAFQLLGQSARAFTGLGDAFSRSAGLHVTRVPHDLSPWLLPPLLLVLTVAVCTLLTQTLRTSRATWPIGIGSAVVVVALATPPMYDVPLALPVGISLGFAVLGLVAAERVGGDTADALRLGAALFMAGAAVVALPSDVLTTIALAVPTVAAGVLMLRPGHTGDAAAAALPLAFTALVWSAASVAGVAEQYRALPALLVLGGLALWRPQPQLELSAALAGTIAAAGSVAYSADLSIALAVYLTVAGAVVTASSIIHPSRRELGWLGGFLLAAATWVRLADLGVQTPEAYTLPSAVALVGVGVWRLRASDRSATLTFLAPGLVLATVPSLVATLVDPYSLRALLLGAACLGLVLVGVTVRWGAPLVVGSAVGGLLVLRELAPYAAEVPTWLSIGVAGAVLLAVGVTWESRMNDVRRASRYVAALR